MTESPEKFSPFKDFVITEQDPEGILPDKVFIKEELKSYVEHRRDKCKTIIEGLSEQNINNDYTFDTLKLKFFELILYSMRHIPHHSAQLILLLRQQIDSAPKWVRRTKNI